MTSEDLVKTWKQIYAPFHFRMLCVSPLSKEAYPGTPVWQSFGRGANIAIQSDGMRHVTLDVDSYRAHPLIRKVMSQTLSWITPKGYGMAFDGPIDERCVRAFYALRYNDLILWNRVVMRDLKFGCMIREKLEALGATDKTAVHGIFKHLDGLSYVLVPPSVSCIYQSKSRDGKNVHGVRQHSSHLQFCNGSPDRKHHYVMREFWNYRPKLMSFNHFIKMILE